MRLILRHAFFIQTLFFFISIHSEPRISIISPFTVHDPIESFIRDITQQPYFNETQLILISKNPDKLIEPIIELYQEKFKNISYIRLPHECNESTLLNQAIQSALAPFLTIIKCGNYRDPYMIQTQLHALESNPDIDLVYSDFLVTNKKAGHNDDSKTWSSVCLPEFKKELMYGTVLGFHYIWRANLHKKYGFFDESLNFCHEWEFWNRCAESNANYKKIEGIAGKLFFDYFAPSDHFNSQNDLERYFHEEEYVRSNYKKYWKNLYASPEKPFVIIIASYNNKLWCKRNLESVFSQCYTNYRIIYCDDCSSDGTGDLVKEYIRSSNKESQVTLITNSHRAGATENIYHAIHSCKKEEIIVILDGDDWLAHDGVLNHLNEIYQDPHVWLTYGQFQWFPHNSIGLSSEITDWVIKENKIRSYKWVTSHLRTFYAGLYQRIRKKDLLYEGKFFPITGDLAIMFPMVEMAGSHCKFISEILYIYNVANVNNDHKNNFTQQIICENVIRNQKPYQLLKSRCF